MSVTQKEFRDAMARLGAAVNIITTAGPAGRGGLTASAVCSVTDDPPTLLVCLNRSSAQTPVFRANGVLCVNTLAAGQRAISAIFAQRSAAVSVEQRFAAGAWSALETGAPLLQGAVASFDCRIAEVVEKGTHSVFFAEVVGVRQGSQHEAGLIWFSRDYHETVVIEGG